MAQEKWTQLVVSTTTFGSDIVSLILTDAGSEGVSVCDSADVLAVMNGEKYWDYIDESLVAEAETQSGEVAVTGGFPTGFDFSPVYAALKDLKNNATEDVGTLSVTLREVNSSDWDSEWKKYYRTLVLGRVAVVPAWESYEKQEGVSAVVRLDPGKAFGTGGHESTAGCLTLLSETDIEGKSVIDYGCGSGILGLAAAGLGAKKCLLIDYDAEAVASARDNAAVSGVEDVCDFLVADSLNEALKAEVILANLTADLLVEFIDGFEAALLPNGVLIAGGVLNGRHAEFEQKACAKFALDKKLTLGDWHAYRFLKREGGV